MSTQTSESASTEVQPISKVPYEAGPTENPNATIVPGQMRSDRQEIPEPFTKADADLAETLEAQAQTSRSAFAPMACQYFWPSPHMVCGAILDKYLSLGAENSFLKHPINVELSNPDGIGSRQEFLVGPIYAHPTAGAHPVVNSFMTKWGSFGWEASFLGYPTTDEIVNSDGIGRRQHFQNADIYWHPLASPGANVIGGAIRDKWALAGGEGPGGLLGYPITDEIWVGASSEGRMNRFERGVIYWSPTTGAHPVTGVILAEWTLAGLEQGSFGYPTSDEYDALPGRKQDFQNEAISFGTLDPVALPFEDCQLNLDWPKTTASTNWVKSFATAHCNDPRLAIGIGLDLFFTPAGGGSEIKQTTGYAETSPDPSNPSVHDASISIQRGCVNGTYRAKATFVLVDEEGHETSPDPHRTKPVVVNNCRTVPPQCPTEMSTWCADAVDTVLWLHSHNWQPKPNVKGGGPYNNDNGALPPPAGGYLEYDIYAGSPRTGERIVVDSGDRLGNMWFTWDHYVPGAFVKFEVP